MLFTRIAKATLDQFLISLRECNFKLASGQRFNCSAWHGNPGSHLNQRAETAWFKFRKCTLFSIRSAISLPADLYIWNSDGDQFKEIAAEGQDLCPEETQFGIQRKDYTLGRFHKELQGTGGGKDGEREEESPSRQHTLRSSVLRAVFL